MNAHKKIPLSAEAAYLIGTVLLGWGTSWMTLADFGVSMVVAPAYLLYLKLSEFWSFLTFGMTQYLLQAVMLLLLIVVIRRFRPTFLLAFANAVLQGLVLDAVDFCTLRLPFFNLSLLPVRLFLYIFGFLIIALGVAFMFRTYLPPAVYELVVKELSSRFGWKLGRVKTVYDLSSLLIGISLSFLFFGLGHFEGIRLGTLIVAVTNSACIALMGKLIDRFYTIRDRFPWRPHFTGEAPNQQEATR